MIPCIKKMYITFKQSSQVLKLCSRHFEENVSVMFILKILNHAFENAKLV